MYNNIVLEQIEHYFVKGILDFESHSTGYIIVHSDQRFWLWFWPQWNVTNIFNHYKNATNGPKFLAVWAYFTIAASTGWNVQGINRTNFQEKKSWPFYQEIGNCCEVTQIKSLTISPNNFHENIFLEIGSENAMPWKFQQGSPKEKNVDQGFLNYGFLPFKWISEILGL